LEFERDVLADACAAVLTARTSQDIKTRLQSEQFDAVIPAREQRTLRRETL
jgi:hypothetical protein